MAGNRISGILPISANFEPQISAPFDARDNVPNRADLLLAATWQALDGNMYIYTGLTVTVSADSVSSAFNGIYILLDPANYNLLASWLFVGSSSGSAITVQDEGITLTTDVQQFDFTGGGVTATTVGNDVTVNIPAATTITVQDEGVTLTTDVQQFNFTGGGVTATTVGNDVTIDIPTGGQTYYGGDGIVIDTVSTGGPYINVDLYTDGCVATHGPNLEFVTNKLNFKGVHIQDEGVDIGTFPVINFVGVDVLSQPQGASDPCVVDVYIPPPTFAPYFNDAASTQCTCTKSFKNLRVSSPTTEGNPYKTNGWAAGGGPESGGTVASYEGNPTTGLLTFTVNSNNQCTGFGGDSLMTVNVYDADTFSTLATWSTSPITADGSYGNGSTIGVNITNYASDTTKFKATPTVTIEIQTILAAQVPSLSGGRFHVQIRHKTDSGTDTGTTYEYFGPNQTGQVASQAYNANNNDVFLDVNNFQGSNPASTPSVPNIAGTTTIIESTIPANILTKHLSGVEYYIIGSQFEVDVTNIDLFNGNTQGKGQASNTYNFQASSPYTNPSFSGYNLSTLNIKAWAPTASQGTFNWSGLVDKWNAQNVDWAYDNWAITSICYRYRGVGAYVQAQVFDPWDNGNVVQSANASILIDTYGTTGNSIKLGESFKDEQYRLIKGATSYTAWDPLVTLSNNLTGNNVTSSGISTGPFSDACTVGSSLVQGSKFFKDNGTTNNDSPTGGYNNLTGDLAPYKPWTNAAGTSGATNPDYTAANNYDRTAVYHRLFEVSPSNNTRTISSFEIGFKGNFPTTGNPYDELVNNNLIVYVRKKQCATTGQNIEAGAVPHSLHNGNMSGAAAEFSGAYANPPTSVDANDGTAQCRTTASAPAASNGFYKISGSFGPPTEHAMEGFYVEIHYKNENIRIDDLYVQINFASGTPTTEGSADTPPVWNCPY